MENNNFHRAVIFEKICSNATIKNDLLTLFYACRKVKFNKSKSDIYLLNDDVLFENDFTRKTFKFHINIWNHIMVLYNNDYDLVQKYTQKFIKTYFSLLFYETRPIRSIFINEIENQKRQNKKKKYKPLPKTLSITLKR